MLKTILCAAMTLSVSTVSLADSFGGAGGPGGVTPEVPCEYRAETDAPNFFRCEARRGSQAIELAAKSEKTRSCFRNGKFAFTFFSFSFALENGFKFKDRETSIVAGRELTNLKYARSDAAFSIWLDEANTRNLVNGEDFSVRRFSVRVNEDEAASQILIDAFGSARLNDRTELTCIAI